MTVTVVVSAAWTGIRALTRVASNLTEPMGLVLLGVSLIALSWLVARRIQSSKRR